MLVLRTTATEHMYQEALRRARSVGLDADGDERRYWAYVTSVYSHLQRRPGNILQKTGALSDWRARQRLCVCGGVAEYRATPVGRLPYGVCAPCHDEFGTLSKSFGGGVAKGAKAGPLGLTPHQPKGKLDAVKMPPSLDSRAMIHRPDQNQPIVGRVVAVGKDGVQVRDDDGNMHRARHEHVLDSLPPISMEEWPEAADELAEMGYEIDPVERFRDPKGGSIDDETEQKLTQLAQSGVPIDAKRAAEKASPEEAEGLLRHYTSVKPSQLPTVVKKDRLAETPGWDKVFRRGKGRSSVQEEEPKRTYELDTDKAADAAYQALQRTGLVAKPQLEPDQKPEDLEHLLRTAAQTLRALAEVVEPPAERPAITVGTKVTGAKGRHVGARYAQKANRIEVGFGLPDSIVHTYAHVLDSDIGGGKYASLDPQSEAGKLVAALGKTKGVSKLRKRIVPGDKPEAEANANSSHRAWMGPPEIFARFFEQWVDHTLSSGSTQALHHLYATGVVLPGALDDEEMAEHGPKLGSAVKTKHKVSRLTLDKGAA